MFKGSRYLFQGPHFGALQPLVFGSVLDLPARIIAVRPFSSLRGFPQVRRGSGTWKLHSYISCQWSHHIHVRTLDCLGILPHQNPTKSQGMLLLGSVRTKDFEEKCVDPIFSPRKSQHPIYLFEKFWGAILFPVDTLEPWGVPPTSHAQHAAFASFAPHHEAAKVTRHKAATLAASWTSCHQLWVAWMVKRLGPMVGTPEECSAASTPWVVWNDDLEEMSTQALLER